MKINRILILTLLLIVFLLCTLIFLKLSSSKKYVVPYLQGRLGNRLFQVFAAKKYAEMHGHTVVFSEKFIKYNPKEEESFDDLKRIFPDIQVIKEIGLHEILNYSDTPWEYIEMPYIDSSVVLDGYFQNYRYIPESIVKSPPIRKTPLLENTYFIHIRGGDYLNHPLHFVDLRKYYGRCIDLIKRADSEAKFLVFSDDNEYANKIMKEYSVTYTISDKVGAFDALAEMSSCVGAICANSSFSWIGSMLQPSHKHIYMPNKWFNDNSKNAGEIYPPWATVVDV